MGRPMLTSRKTGSWPRRYYIQFEPRRGGVINNVEPFKTPGVSCIDTTLLQKSCSDLKPLLRSSMTDGICAEEIEKSPLNSILKLERLYPVPNTLLRLSNVTHVYKYTLIQRYIFTFNK